MSFFSKLGSLFKRKKHHVYYNFESDLPQEDIDENREQILNMLKRTNRPGIDKVIAYMDKNDFFSMPSSIHKHHNYRGGLAKHVLSVYCRMKEAAPDLPDDSVIIVSLLHDICKADLYRYQSDGGLLRNHGKSQRRGMKSIKILNDCGMQLTESERLAIRWHMGGQNARADELDDSNKARRDPLSVTLFRCNREDSYTY